MRHATQVVEVTVGQLGSLKLVADDAPPRWPQKRVWKMILGHTTGVQVDIVRMAIYFAEFVNDL